MKRSIRITLLAILAFAIILLVRLPASWVKGFLPPGVTCAEIAGTAWDGGNRYVAHDLQAQMPLDPPVLPQLDSGYAGSISVNLANLQVEKNLITAIEGQVQATSLYSKRDRLALGGYSASFPKAPAGSEPVGQVTSLEGPVDFEGTIKLTHQPGWVVDGKIRTKPETPKAFTDQLAYLGAPDAQGFRPLTLEGSF
jgi:Type II secretion system (T2SS), protein N